MQTRVRATLAIPMLAATLALAAGLAACGNSPAPAASSGQQANSAAAAGHAAAASASPGSGQPAGGLQIPPVARQVRCPGAGQLIIGMNPPLPAAQPIPAGFKPVAVVECVHASPALAAQVPGTEIRRQVAVAGLAKLMAALRIQPKPRGDSGPVAVCVQAAVTTPWFVLIGADGQIIRPKVATTACGAPIEPVLAALDSLHWVTLGTSVQPGLSVGAHPNVSPVAPPAGS